MLFAFDSSLLLTGFLDDALVEDRAEEVPPAPSDLLVSLGSGI
jgi:hypothetical protein